jgi:ubiquinone/menaquinone biosynthesis C-methylase UbiE
VNVRRLVALVAASLIMSCVHPSQSVRPGINAPFTAANASGARFNSVFEEESREVFTHREAIIDLLSLQSGMVVADVGSGTGSLLELLVRGVGPSGRIYAVDVVPQFIDYIRDRAAANDWRQVVPVLGSDRSVGLPPSSVDVVFICDTYHHFEFPNDTLASIRRALRPGGVLIVVDFDRVDGVSRPWVLEHVRAGRDVVRREVEQAGFMFERDLTPSVLRENYILRFTSPS